jgi:hypothetical protein
VPPTPEPTASGTPDPEGTQEGESATGLSAIPTVTPTFTPSPTPTPIIVPTQPPTVQPRTRDPLSFLIPALSAGLFILLAIIVLLLSALLLYWYWEWRGMRGLNPVLRAYARLERYLRLIGIRFDPEQTPAERRSRIVRVMPVAEPPVSTITTLYTAERYGPPADSQRETRDELADDSWADARGSIVLRWLRRTFMPWTRRRDDRG